MKSVLIEEVVHEKLKEASKKSGIKIKVLVESGIEYYLKHLRIGDSQKTIWEELNERS